MTNSKRFNTVAAAAFMGLMAANTRADVLTVNSFGTTNDGSTGWTAGHFNTSGGVYDPTAFVKYDVPTLNVLGDSGLNEFSTGATDPNVIVNTNTSTDYTVGGNEVFQKNTVNMGPYLGPSVIEYNVSSTGIYNISSAFETVQTVNEYPTAYLYVGGMLVQGKALTGAPGAQYGDSVSINYDGVGLIAGEKIDFVVWGADSNNKTTQIAASVLPGVSASTPLPASAGVGFSMLGLFGGLAVLRKRLFLNNRIA